MALFVVKVIAAPKSYELSSPDGTVRTVVTVGEEVNYSIWKNSDRLLNPSVISMDLMDGSSYDASVKLQKVERSTVDNTLDALFYKKDKVRENYNELKLRFRTYDLIFRAYDAGVAYRFVSKSKAPFKVKGEVAEFSFPEDWNAYVPYVKAAVKGFDNQFCSSFENTYKNIPISAWDNGRLAFLPLMVQSPQGYKINIMESDLTDYPGMYLYNSDGDSTLEAVFPRYPKDVEQGGHNMLQGVVKSREEYIAEYDGATAFPWRIVNISTEDKEMLDNDLVWLLGAPADPSADWSWVKPGKVAWDWWNDWNLTGVDFKAGVNNATYEYYIDFASRNGIEYVILDEGWAVNLEADLFKVVPEIDLEKLVAYAAERNVGLVLWAGYWAFDKDMEKICEHYAKMGIKGWKVDFMDRDDQVVVDFYTRAAATAAKYRQFVDFHGGYEPSGLNRTYPNVLNYEGVFGLEQMKWSKPEVDMITYDVTFPYIRMAAGPVDYTQGAMLNAGRKYVPNRSEPMSQGTRCHQLGMYVTYESPFNMLCDTPIHYEREKECTDFIASVPTVWDETVALDGKVGEYVIMARRSGDVWYIGGLTNWDARDVELDLNALGAGGWNVEMFADGVNVEKNAKDYKVVRTQNTDKLKVRMASGGGFAARLTR